MSIYNCKWDDGASNYDIITFDCIVKSFSFRYPLGNLQDKLESGKIMQIGRDVRTGCR